MKKLHSTSLHPGLNFLFKKKKKFSLLFFLPMYTIFSCGSENRNVHHIRFVKLISSGVRNSIKCYMYSIRRLSTIQQKLGIYYRLRRIQGESSMFSVHVEKFLYQITFLRAKEEGEKYHWLWDHNVHLSSFSVVTRGK